MHQPMIVSIHHLIRGNSLKHFFFGRDGRMLHIPKIYLAKLIYRTQFTTEYSELSFYKLGYFTY